MYENKQELIFDTIFRNGIQQFLEIHIKCCDTYKKDPLTFAGSVAFYMQDYIHQIAEKKKYSYKKSYNLVLKI